MLCVYVHVPFCVKKCHYCGFYSTSYGPETADEYIFSLRRQIESSRDLFADRSIGTLYIGGGTPTVLSPVQLGQILSSLAENLPVAPGAEWTLEANPGSLSSSHLSLSKKWGVNRISLGVQSLNDELLIFLGRPHRAKEANDAVRMARSAGFSNIGMDLIYGIPGQTDQQWAETLCKAITLEPQHISVYSLSLDQGSLFTKRAHEGAFTMPDDESVAAQYGFAQHELKSAGYEQYEVSNFCLPGFHCRHNLNYWTRGDYLGLGPGASTFLGDRRYASVADITEYCGRLERGESVFDEQEILTVQQAASEVLMLGLRITAGVDLRAYEKQFGIEAAGRIERNTVRFRNAGLMEVREGHLRLTSGGFLLSDELLKCLLP